MDGLHEQHQPSEALRATLGTYLPTDRLRALAVGLELPEQTHGSALMVDISGFTALTEALVRTLGLRRGTEVLPHYLNDIYDALITEIHRYGGSVIGFSGDAMTCWFDQDDGLQAVAAGLALQTLMQTFAALDVGAGEGDSRDDGDGSETVRLSAKVGVAVGPVRRFLVGDADIQRFDVIVGQTLTAMARAEAHAQKGEVVLAGADATRLAHDLDTTEVRTATSSADHANDTYVVVVGLRSERIEQRDVPLTPSSLAKTSLKAWLPRAVFDRLCAGQGEFLTELRPAVALFMRFDGIDYDHDPDARRKLDTFIRWVQGVVDRFEGTLIQLTFGDKGSYLYAAFGAPVAHEDDSRRAAQVALILRRPPTELDFVEAIQIGLSRGTMRTGAYGGRTRRTYGVLGDDVNFAARLMSRAEPGQVIVSKRIYWSIADAATLRPLGEATFKGKSHALEIFALESLEQNESMIKRRNDLLPLVGRRQVELDRLTRGFEDALRGQGTLARIEADAGLGKSRLLHEAIQRATQRGLHVYAHTCPSYGFRVLDLAWQSLLRQLLGIDPKSALSVQEAVLKDAVASVDLELIPRLPLLATVLGVPMDDTDVTKNLDAELRKASTEALIIDLLQAKLAKTPSLIVIDDAQWLDASSFDLLVVLSRVLDDLPATVLLAHRPSGLPVTRVDELHTSPTTVTVTLGELDATDLETLVRAKLAQFGYDDMSFAPKLVERLLHSAQGNPFYVEEVLNYLGNRNLDLHDSSAWQVLPASLQSLVLSRVDQLDELQQILLRVASILGRRFSLDWLCGYYPSLGGVERVVSQLSALQQLGLIEHSAMRPDVYAFRHVLTQEVIYESQGYQTRQTLHERAAHYLETHSEAGDNKIELLAYHFGRSANVAKQREYLYKAGARAQANYANEDAENHYRTLLPLLSDDPVGDDPGRCQVGLELAAVLERIGTWDEAEQLLHDISRDPRYKTEALYRLGLLMSKRGELLRSETYLREAIAAEPNRLEFYSQLGKTLAQKGELEDARQALDRALGLATQMAESERKSAAIADVYVEVAELEHHAGQHKKIVDLLTKVEKSIPSDRKIAKARIFHLLGLAYQGLADLERAKQCGESAQELYQEVGDVERAATIKQNIANVLFAMGHKTEALQMLREVRSQARRLGNRKLEAIATYNQGFELRELKRYEEAIELLEHSRDIFKEIKARLLEIHVCLELAESYTRIKNMVDAQQLLDTVREQLEDAPHEFYEASWAYLQGRLLLILGRAPDAEAFLTRSMQAFTTLETLDSVLDNHLKLAVTYLILGREDRCVEQLNAALSLAKDLDETEAFLTATYIQALLRSDDLSIARLHDDFAEAELEHEIDDLQAVLAANNYDPLSSEKNAAE